MIAEDKSERDTEREIEGKRAATHVYIRRDPTDTTSVKAIRFKKLTCSVIYSVKTDVRRDSFKETAISKLEFE